MSARPAAVRDLLDLLNLIGRTERLRLSGEAAAWAMPEGIGDEWEARGLGDAGFELFHAARGGPGGGGVGFALAEGLYEAAGRSLGIRLGMELALPDGGVSARFRDLLRGSAGLRDEATYGERASGGRAGTKRDWQSPADAFVRLCQQSALLAFREGVAISVFDQAQRTFVRGSLRRHDDPDQPELLLLMREECHRSAVGLLGGDNDALTMALAPLNAAGVFAELANERVRAEFRKRFAGYARRGHAPERAARLTRAAIGAEMDTATGERWAWLCRIAGLPLERSDLDSFMRLART